MIRLLEFIVAIILVIIAAIVVGLFLPAHGHVQRALDVSHEPHQIYDLLNNFRRFPDYSGPVLKAEDPNVRISLSGAPYGPGAKVSWSGNDKIGHATLTNESGNLEPTGQGRIVWSLDSDWRGKNKKFVIDFEPKNNQRLTTVTWSYDVDYGWNLLDRYSQFFLRGDPDTLIQYSLTGVQNTLASIPNVDYTKIAPRIVQTQPRPVLFVSTQAPRTLDDVDAATAKALAQIDAVIKKLGVHQAGPRITITTDYGDENYVFDVAVPIDAATININGQSHDLAQAPEVTVKPIDANATQNQNPNQPPPTPPAAGRLDAKGHLVVEGDVRAMMMEGGRVLEADWDGTPAGIPLTRLALKAYALTHGYAFDDTTHRYYDELVTPGNVPYDQQKFRVFLPLQGDVPAQTPDQAAGKVPELPPLDPSVWGRGGAPAAAPAAAPPVKVAAKKKAGRH